MYEEKSKTDMRPNLQGQMEMRSKSSLFGLRVCLHIWPTTYEFFIVNAIKKGY